MGPVWVPFEGMHDRHFLRSNPDQARAAIARKRMSAPIDEFLRAEEERRAATTEASTKKAELNTISKSIGALMGQDKKDEAEAAKATAKAISDDISALEQKEREMDAALEAIELRIPNMPHESVPDGEGEEDNVIVRTFGEARVFDDAPKPHWELAESLKLVDFARGTKISGTGFILYTGLGARLQRALFSYFIDFQTLKNGYREVYPPAMVLRQSLVGTGNLPKFEEDLYKVEDDLFLIPTAEVPVTNIYKDEILRGEDLTLKFAAFTSCFRKEAGSAGKDTRGIQRTHQFEKVELVKFTKPEDSYVELESLTNDAESLLKSLGLHYRVVSVCGPETSFSNAKQYDLEVWAPGVGRFLEVSSCSNFEAFQARRANIRFRRAAGEKPEFVHTLNGSGLALPRIYGAILETYQRPDGSVEVPKPLRPYLGCAELRPDSEAPKSCAAFRGITVAKAQTPGLTPRESEIAGLVAKGLTNRQIAASIGIVEQSVKNAVTVILTKLGLDNRVQLALHMMHLEE